MSTARDKLTSLRGFLLEMKVHARTADGATQLVSQGVLYSEIMRLLKEPDDAAPENIVAKASNAPAALREAVRNYVKASKWVIECNNLNSEEIKRARIKKEVERERAGFNKDCDALQKFPGAIPGETWRMIAERQARTRAALLKVVDDRIWELVKRRNSEPGGIPRGVTDAIIREVRKVRAAMEAVK